MACVAYASAGLIGAPGAVTYSAAPAVSHVSYASPIVSYGSPAITTQHQNILRSPGNLQQISTYSKTIDTPFSSVSKSDVRVSNPGLAVAALPAPALAYASHAPVAYSAPAPAAIATGHGLLGVAYSAAPAVSHMTYSNGLGFSYGW